MSTCRHGLLLSTFPNDSNCLESFGNGQSREQGAKSGGPGGKHSQNANSLTKLPSLAARGPHRARLRQ